MTLNNQVAAVNAWVNTYGVTSAGKPSQFLIDMIQLCGWYGGQVTITSNPVAGSVYIGGVVLTTQQYFALGQALGIV